MPYRHLYGKTLICCSYLYLHLISPTSGQVSTYPLILGNIKTNGLITSSKYPIKYLESVFVLINFETNMLSTLTSRIFIFSFLFILFYSFYLFIYLFNYLIIFLHHKISSFTTFVLPKLKIIILLKFVIIFSILLLLTNFAIIFWLIDRRTNYSNRDFDL